MYPKLSRLLRSCFLLLFTSLFLAACTSDETADSGTGSGTATGVETGDVTLLITDAPTSKYDEVNVTAESVALVGEGDDAELMSRPARFNLLDLRNTFRRLSKSKARVGTYSKVRFRIRDIELVKRDQYGTITERVIPRLRSNEVNLNARTQFAVNRLRQLIVKLDLDADTSVTTDPVTDEPVFDPDATVDVDSVPTDTTEPPQDVTPVLMKEVGVARNLLADSFQLCDPALLENCTQVNVSPETVLPQGFDENTSVMVFGHLDVTTDTVNALHVLLDSSTYTGTFVGAVTSDAINFTVTAGTMAGTTYPVKPVSGAGVYDSAGNVLDETALVDGVNAEIVGTLQPFPPPGTIAPGVIIIPIP